MLNELYQAVLALKRRGVVVEERHPSLTPMGKNSPLLVVELDSEGKPVRVAVEPSEIAGKLVRIRHGSQGASFPGFNLPTPLRRVRVRDPETRVERLASLFEQIRRRRFTSEKVARLIQRLYAHSSPAEFTKSHTKQFKRSVEELVGWLRSDFAAAGAELNNFVRLLQIVGDARLELEIFSESLATLLAAPEESHSQEQRLLFAEWLFTERQLPLYLELRQTDTAALPIAHFRLGDLLNRQLLAISALPYDSRSRPSVPRSSKRKGRQSSASLPHDAFTGAECEIAARFPEPKVAVLGDVRLFSNTNEAACFSRYGLEKSNSFKVSEGTARKMADVLLMLAADGRVGKTCRSIPGGRKGQRQLLIVYLQDDPGATDPFTDLFGTQTESTQDADFAAVAEPILKALEGRVATNPNQLLQLLAIAPLDKANKQVSLLRSYKVADVQQAALAWASATRNCPDVTLPFFDRETRKPSQKCRTVPSPLDAAALANKVWSSDPKGGFRSSFQRILSTSDAFDLFLSPRAIRQTKCLLVLQTLLNRMGRIFERTGRLKATSNFTELNEPARWAALKGVAFIGICLQQLGFEHEQFMKDSIYQVGRLLALADRLHFQYCKWVRTSGENRTKNKVAAPSELLGNSLFNFALDHPVSSLARLAERIRPYKGWADSYSGEDSGLVHWFVRQMGSCEQLIDASKLPERMEDIHKAQLLLGYLADQSSSEDKKE